LLTPTDAEDFLRTVCVVYRRFFFFFFDFSPHVHRWFHGFLSFEEAVRLLDDQDIGTFLGASPFEPSPAIAMLSVCCMFFVHSLHTGSRRRVCYQLY
jgi:hypothetical protein